MNTFVDDTNLVTETDSVMFSMPQQGQVSASVVLTNLGTNTLTYHFQQYNGSAWVEMGTIGTPLYNTLVSGQVVQILVSSMYPQVQMLASASGGSTVGFALTRWFSRSNGGAVPLLAGF